jgi:hypothetical protein
MHADAVVHAFDALGLERCVAAGHDVANRPPERAPDLGAHVARNIGRTDCPSSSPAPATPSYQPPFEVQSAACWFSSSDDVLAGEA